MNSERVDTSTQGVEPEPEHYWHVPRLFIAWVGTALVALAVSFMFTWNSDRMEWFTISIAFGTLLTFGLQLGTAQRQGFIARTALSVGGAVLIVAVIAGVVFLAGW